VHFTCLRTFQFFVYNRFILFSLFLFFFRYLRKIKHNVNTCLHTIHTRFNNLYMCSCNDAQKRISMNTRQYFFVFIINKLLHNRRTSILTLCLSISSRRAFFSFLSFIEEKIEKRALIVSQSFKNNINRKKKSSERLHFFFY